MSNNIFKIKRLTDGKFSGGGAKPKFSKTGKVWTSKGYIIAHLKLMKEYKTLDMYDKCNIIEYTLKEEGSYNMTYFNFTSGI